MSRLLKSSRMRVERILSNKQHKEQGRTITRCLSEWFKDSKGTQ